MAAMCSLRSANLVASFFSWGPS
ncbi:MAG: hypothetical protein QOC94_1567, partial [Actinoplanes sp.]|nr:hypothetical protein [Actinoplanes sp.]